MIYKGLDDEEAVFLQFVADKRAKLDAETRDEENQELLAYRVGEGRTVLSTSHLNTSPLSFPLSTLSFHSLFLYCDHLLTLSPSPSLLPPMILVSKSFYWLCK